MYIETLDLRYHTQLLHFLELTKLIRQGSGIMDDYQHVRDQ